MKIRRLVAVLALCAVLVQPVWAEELPIKKASEHGATVSNEVDTASNYDPSMGTRYFMYIPPDPVYEMPKMGGDGVSRKQLVWITLGTGLGYLAVSIYARKRNHR